MTCEIQATPLPITQGGPRESQHPPWRPSTPGKSWEGMRCGCAQRCQGSTPGTWSHQDLACLTVHPAQLKSILSVALLGKLRHGAMQEPRTTLPPLAPAAPSNLVGTGRFPGPLHRDRHRDAAHHLHPNPWWNIPRAVGGRQGFPRTASPVTPSTSCSRAQIPPGSPGHAPVFLAMGPAASPPQLRAGWGAASGQKLSLRLFFPVNPCEGSRQRPGSGAVQAHEIFRGQSF